MKEKIIYHFSGKLVLSFSNLNKMNYGLFDNSVANIRFISLSDILDRIYSLSPTLPEVKVTITQLDTGHRICKEGVLNIGRDKYGVEDWSLGKFPLGLYLFELVDKKIEIWIEYLEEAENMEAVGSNERTTKDATAK